MICPHCGHAISGRVLDVAQLPLLPVVADPRVPDNAFVFVNNAACANPVQFPSPAFWPGWLNNACAAASPVNPGAIIPINF